MRIALTLTPPSDQYFRWAAQIGATDFVCRNPQYYGLDAVDGLDHMHARASSFGLRMSAVEGYLPLESIIVGGPERDMQIAQLVRMIERMGKLGVEVLCYNFMPVSDWFRTSFTLPERGGALTCGFDASALPDELAPASRRLPVERLWDNLAYMLRHLVPAAEYSGVKLAAHPDDPPLAQIKGAHQILYGPDCFDRLVQLVPSPVNGICMCQGTFAEMGADIPATIRRFARHIHYVHFRDIRGRADNFTETFHDNGMTDMAAAMRTYKEISFTGPMRPDHVPALDGEGDGTGYTMLGRLFAVGYMRGLMHGIQA